MHARGCHGEPPQSPPPAGAKSSVPHSMVQVAVLAAVAALAAQGALPTVIVTSWCDNSFRVRVLPPDMPPAARAAAFFSSSAFVSKTA